MTQRKLYKYIGINGTITSPILLANIDHIKMIELTASNGKYLTNGKRQVYSIIVPADDVQNWAEIDLDINE